VIQRASSEAGTPPPRDVVRLRQALEGLHAERSPRAPGLIWRKLDNVESHPPRGNGVDPDAAGASAAAKCFTRVSMAPLVAA